MIDFAYKPFEIELKHVFRISRGERKGASVMLTKLSYEGVDGYGEGCLIPLYGESLKTANEFFSKVDLSQFKDPFDVEAILSYVNEIDSGNQAAKTAIDIALHDLIGKLLKLPVYQLFGLSETKMHTSMTIGIDSPLAMAERAKEYKSFKYLKIKLGTPNDKEIIEAIRAVSNQPFFIDANQGWAKKEEALEFIKYLEDQNTVFIEQPMLKEDKQGNAWISERSPIPIIGDEGFQRLTDIKEASGIYNGINIKLMKSTGIREGYKMAVSAKALGMKVMIGCMTETSCAISGAAQLMPLADWVDLDGNLDAINDPFRGVQVIDGEISLNSNPGIGLESVNWERIK